VKNGQSAATCFAVSEKDFAEDSIPPSSSVDSGSGLSRTVEKEMDDG